MGTTQSVQRYQMKMTSDGRRPQMEDDLKIRKVEYLSNHWSDLAKKNLSTWKQPRVLMYEIKMTSNGRRPQMEDDLKWKMTSKYEK